MRKILFVVFASLLIVSIMIIVTFNINSTKGTEEEKEEETEGLSWDMAEEILTHISDPEFPEYKVNIMDFGANADGSTLDTKAFEKAIQHVNEQGGGTVVVPEGTYLIGSIELLSNVNLHLKDENTLIKFTTDINENNYPVAYSHWESTPVYNYRALIYAYDAENIAVTGKGTLDGQASDSVWWDWKHQIEATWSESDESLQEKASNQLRDMNNSGVPVEERVFGDGGYLRPNFIQIIESENVLLEDVTLNNSPMWQVNPVLSTNITVRGMTLQSHGHNNDGIDPESSNYVLIEDNFFDTGDDGIAIKSGRDLDGRELDIPSQNIIIQNNTFADGHGGIALGSEMSGGIKNVFANNNHFDSPNLTYPLRFKTNAKRGGVIENIYLGNSEIETINEATIHGTMYYADGKNGDYLPEFKNILIENVKSNGGEYGIFMEAFEEVPIKGLVLRNVEITNTANAIRAMNWADDTVMENVTINGETYPRPTDTRILGVPSPGAQLNATSLLIGGNTDTISYTWLISDTKDGTYEQIATGEQWTVPENVAGKFIKVTVKDKNNSEQTSIAYQVLKNNQVTNSDSSVEFAANRIASKGIINPDSTINLNTEITRIEVARMLSKMWDLTTPEQDIDIDDIDKSDPDYDMVAAVLEEEMLVLQDGNFNPNDTITREEMASVAVMSSGLSFKNASTIYDSTFNDGDEIEDVYLTNVERAKQFNFLTEKESDIFSPKDEVTYAEAIEVMDRVSDFAGK
ncbi:glycoside hydrolase family 28 protein [Virgibacillus sp. NKC19-3]|uniref:glycoside hydrolase family 28 protein n=1 Tax=Virgibacillus saliphilus TaxID=2831674 RepID=UPI001C9B54A8|nr:glycoside hydrolase family 28 protein [Virgibacillus sp. NKC19-3]MBY7142299.1 glycoside hydrolase family 28 protein [Virgibacillus sp. NKC19-3]